MSFRRDAVRWTIALAIVAVPGLGAAAAPSATRPSSRPAAPADLPFWTGSPDAPTFTRFQDYRLRRAQEIVDRLVAAKGPRTIATTLQAYDTALRELDAAGAQSGLIEQVHPDAALRDSAEKVSQRVSAFATTLSLDRRVYDALAAIDLSAADAETRYYVEKTLRDFRLSGVDRDQATRDRIKKLQDELVLTGQEFSRNIREDVRTVTVTDTAELAGLPPDYVSRHKPDASGKITLTIDYPDAFPVFNYAKNEGLRKRLFFEYNNRAYPKNMAVLDSMISRRWRLATLLGYPNWADYITANKMVGTAKNASDFIDRIVEASGPGADREYQILLKARQKDAPSATQVNAWESGYYTERVRKSEYDFDSQKLRPYFPYERVKQGVLDVTGRLFGVTYRRVEGVAVWDPSVECWEMLDHGRTVGRFYLDMHPRKNKFNHAAHFRIRTGIEGVQMPEAALICNLPGGEPGDPGLMEQGDVVTFFHEFGHLIHNLFAGHHRWVGVSGIRTERDFIEAPSQMLEEWTRDPAVLATFARHYQTGEPVPAALVKQMVRAQDFAKAIGVRRQMVYAKTSLSIYDRAPGEVNTDRITRELTEKYQPFPYVEGTHFQTAFGHLDGYSAVYYTYMWSLVIAKDMFSRFDKAHLLDPAVPARYRETVLAPGGSMPAAKLVENFLGRPFGFESYRAWLDEVN